MAAFDHPPKFGWGTRHINTTVCQDFEIDRLKAELAEAEKQLQDEKDSRHKRFLEWRGILENEYDDGKCCKGCSGTGYKVYGSTSTWSGGIGGQQITSGICDKCWGSGDINNPWTNLRYIGGLKHQLSEAKAEVERLQVEECCVDPCYFEHSNAQARQEAARECYVIAQDILVKAMERDNFIGDAMDDLLDEIKTKFKLEVCCETTIEEIKE